jgi:hypothetical protein
VRAALFDQIRKLVAERKLAALLRDRLGFGDELLLVLEQRLARVAIRLGFVGIPALCHARLRFYTYGFELETSGLRNQFTASRNRERFKISIVAKYVWAARPASKSGTSGDWPTSRTPCMQLG